MSLNYADLLKVFGICAALAVNGVFSLLGMGHGGLFTNVSRSGVIKAFGKLCLRKYNTVLTMNLLYWTDEKRLSFLELMFCLGFKVLHEPWIRDEDRALYPLKSDTLPPKDDIFSKLDDVELDIYQKNFLRYFGNSLFNVSVGISAFYISKTNLEKIERYRKSPFYLDIPHGRRKQQ
jgi:hypothetical protein